MTARFLDQSILLFVLAVFGAPAWAQLTTELLIGATEQLPPVTASGEHSGFPLNTFWHDQRLQAVYLAPELITAGLGPNATISAISLRCAQPPGRPVANFRIRFGHTTEGSVTSFSTSGLVTHFGPSTIPVAGFNTGEWHSFTLTTPFVWDGTRNVVIDFSTDDTDWSYGGGCFVRAVGADRCRYGYSDSGSAWPFDFVSQQASAPIVPSLRVSFAPGALGIQTESPLPGAGTGVAYEHDIKAAAGTLPYTWSLVSGNLPPGLTLAQHGSVYRLSGTPGQTAAGQTYTFTVQVQDDVQSVVQRQFQLQVQGVQINGPAVLPTAHEGSPYQHVFSAGNGFLPYSWSVVAGTLPAGMQMDPMGDEYHLTGAPAAGAGGQLYQFTVRVAESGGSSHQLASQIYVAGGPAALPFVDDFSTDRGWTLGSQTGSGSGVVQWQRAPCGPAYQPAYGQPEPTIDHSPGTDNYILGDNIGSVYPSQLNSTAWAVSPAVDCSGVSNVELSFRRWLNVEQPGYDRAYIEVSGNDGATWTRVWQNQATITDTQWSLQRIDISAVAGHMPAVRVRFGIGPTDSTWEFAGWCIDDFAVRELPSTTKLVMTDFSILSQYTLGSQLDALVYTGTQTPFELRVDNTTGSDITVSTFEVTVNMHNQTSPEDVGTFTLSTPLPIVVPALATQFVIAGTFDCLRLASGGASVTLQAHALLQGSEAGSGAAVATQATERLYIDLGPPPPPPMLEVRETSFSGPLIGHDQPATGTLRDFGSVDLDAGSFPFIGRNIVIRNGTNQPVNVSVPVLAGPDAAHFRLNTSQWTGPAITLSPTGAGSQIFFTARFDPHGLGTLNAWVEFTHDAVNPTVSPYRIPLTGQGTGNPPALEVREVLFSGPAVANSQAAAGTNRDFGPAAAGGSGTWLNVVLWNRRTQDTVIDPPPSLAGPDAADFELFFFPGEVQDSGPFTIPGTTAFTETTFFAVRFKPGAATAGGAKSAFVTLGHSADLPAGQMLPNGNTEFVIQLSGFAVDTPSPLVTVYEADGPAAQSGNPTFAVTHNSSAAHGRDFGAHAPGAGSTAFATFRVINPGTQALTIGNPVIVGASAADFVLQTGAPWVFSTVVQPGSFVEFGVAFDPGAPGQVTAHVSFTHDAALGAASPFLFEISGLGQLDAPVLEMFEDSQSGTPVANNATAGGTSRDFGSRDVNLGPSAPRTIYVANTGTQDLVLGTPTFAGTHAAEFVLHTGGMLTTLPPAGHTTFEVAFAPGSYGPKAAWIEFSHNDPLLASPFRFEVAGFGDAPSLEVREGDSAGPILQHDAPPTGPRDFGTLQLAALPSAPLTITLVNAGNADLNVALASMTGPEAASFQVTAPGMPALVPGGQSVTFTLVFQASQVGLKEATLEILHSDPALPGPFAINVRGVAADPAGVRIDSVPRLPNGRIGSDYGPVELKAVGGSGNYAWSLRPGSNLPTGLSLSPTGRLSGEPTGPAGLFEFDIRVQDSNGGTADQWFRLTVDPAPGLSNPKSGGSDGCAATGGAPGVAWVVVVTLAVARRRFRR